MHDGRHDLIAQGWNKPDTYRHSSVSAFKSQDYYSFFLSRYGFGVLPSWLAGLRAGCLPLQVELGRFTCLKTPTNSDYVKCLVKLQRTKHFLLMRPYLENPEWYYLSQCQRNIKPLSLNQLQRNCLSSSTHRNTYIVSPWVFIICILVDKN